MRPVSTIRSVALAAALLLTGLLLAGLSVEPSAATRDVQVIVGFGNHGLHLGDLPIVGAWLVGMALCGVLWVRD
ncbi:hypothetical protein ENKNEFLB_00840 [Nocardioides aquaticus]|uniref:Uncharacterized protein n=1 Tax=Nocardioides aquaticus TaxID=160826 RepID=A0ABX8EDB2_9ACTN|nr:hypothetical protein ENKNEFLB_00840 [Nocardioides aquaticus]